MTGNANGSHGAPWLFDRHGADEEEKTRILTLLKIQARLDSLTAIMRGYEAISGKGNYLDVILSIVQRHGRQHLIWKAERGLPVTEVDVFKTSILDGRVSGSELFLLHAAEQADRARSKPPKEERENSVARPRRVRPTDDEPRTSAWSTSAQTKHQTRRDPGQ